MQEELKQQMREDFEAFKQRNNVTGGDSLLWRMWSDGYVAAWNRRTPVSGEVAEGVEVDRNAASPAAPALRDDATANGWISVDERLPSVDQLVMVYSPPTQYDHPGDVNISFDCIDPNDDDHASWLGHNEHYEHFCCVAKPEGSIGPSEKAPYTHWQPRPAAPGASSLPAGSACQGGNTNPETQQISAQGIDHAKLGDAVQAEIDGISAEIDRQLENLTNLSGEGIDPETLALANEAVAAIEGRKSDHAKLAEGERAAFDKWAQTEYRNSDSYTNSAYQYGLAAWQARGQQAGGAEGNTKGDRE